MGFYLLDVAHIQWQYSFDCLLAEEAGEPTPPTPEPPAHIRADVLRELSDIPADEWLTVLPFVMTKSERADIRVNIPSERVGGYVQKLWEEFRDQRSIDLNDVLAYGDIDEWNEARAARPVDTNINDSCYALWLQRFYDPGQSEIVRTRAIALSEGFYQKAEGTPVSE